MFKNVMYFLREVFLKDEFDIRMKESMTFFGWAWLKIGGGTNQGLENIAEIINLNGERWFDAY